MTTGHPGPPQHDHHPDSPSDLLASHHHGQAHHRHDHSANHDRAGGIGRFLRGIFVPHSHGAAEAIDGALTSSSQGIRAVKISLVLLALTAAMQLVVVAISGSVALLADTIHNLSDALTAFPLWIAFVLGRRQATRRYTYGYGRGEDLAGLFVVLMIAMSALTAGWQAIDRLLNPQPVNNLGWVAAAGLVGFAGNELVAQVRIRTGRRIGSAALVADGLHARTDGFTSLAVVAGAGGAAAGWTLADPIIGLVITIMILAILRTTARDIVRRLMDAVDPSLIDAAEAALGAEPRLQGVRHVRMRWIGHQLHAEAELTVDAGTGLADAHRVGHEAEHALMHAIPSLARALVVVAPAQPGDTQIDPKFMGR